MPLAHSAAPEDVQYAPAEAWKCERMQGLNSESRPIPTVMDLYRALSPERRRRLLVVVAALVASALSELLTIGAVLPFLALVADPARAADLPGFSVFHSLVGGGSGEALIQKSTALLIAAAVLAAAMRLLILRLSQNFVVLVAHDISTGIFARILRQPYSLYVSRNSSLVLASLEKLQILVSGVLLPLVQGCVAAVLVFCIGLLLFAIDPLMASAAAATMGLLYLALIAAFRRRLKANSTAVAGASTARMKTWREGIGSIRDILLEGSQPVFEDAFRRLDRQFRSGQSFAWFAAQAPRYVVEAAGIILIGLLALYMSARPGGVTSALPVLGALALGAQRLMPLVQQFYSGATLVTGNLQVLRDVLDLLQAPVVKSIPPSEAAPLPFAREIALEGVGFQFEGRSEWALSGIDLSIPKGSRVGLVGPSGSGKSTFFDLLMGLLEPTSGRIMIDGTPLSEENRNRWQRQIAHVPQSIYLTDSSIASNIAFGGPEDAIDHERVREAARRAQIHAFIEELPAGYDTRVGERGVQLSGGQRQRIAIARALYKRASVLIFDEATAALDEESEAGVVQAISESHPDITILIAAHRRSVFSCCDRIIRFDKGRLIG